MRSKATDYFIQPSVLDPSGRPLDVYPEFINFLPGTAVRIWHTCSDSYSPMHWHSCIEILYCYEGEYSVGTPDHTFTISNGSILVIPGEIMHDFKSAAPCKGFVHLLGTDFIRNIPSIARLLPLFTKPFLLSKSDMPQLYSSVYTRLLRMREAYFSDNSLREAIMDAQLLNILEHIFNILLQDDAAKGSAKFDKRGRYQQVMNNVLIYVNSNLTDEININDIAKRFGLSRSHFMHLFKQYTSYSFVEYLSLRRVQEAERLLTLPELTLTEIASRVGFGSVASFTRVFKEVYKILPSEYRKQLSLSMNR